MASCLMAHAPCVFPTLEFESPVGKTQVSRCTLDAVIHRHPRVIRLIICSLEACLHSGSAGLLNVDCSAHL